MNTTCTIIKMRNILLGNKINKTYIEMPGQTELKQCDYMIQGDHEAVPLTHRPWNITASTPNAIVNYLCWAKFSLRFWHFWWVSSLFQWLPTIRKPVLSISLIVRRLYIRISLTTRENTLVARDGEGFVEVAMLLHVLMFWGLLARPAGRSDWPAENYPVRTSRVMYCENCRCCQAPPCGETAGAARRRLAEKLPVLPGAALRRNCRCCQAPPCGETAGAARRRLAEKLPVLPGAALRRNCRCCQAPPCGETAAATVLEISDKNVSVF